MDTGEDASLKFESKVGRQSANQPVIAPVRHAKLEGKPYGKKSAEGLANKPLDSSKSMMIKCLSDHVSDAKERNM